VANATLRNKLDVLFSLSLQVSWKTVKVDARVIRRLVVNSHWSSDTLKKWLEVL